MLLFAIFFKKVTKGEITRAKEYLMGKKSNVVACIKCPKDAREELWRYLRERKESSTKNMMVELDESGDETSFNLVALAKIAMDLF